MVRLGTMYVALFYLMIGGKLYLATSQSIHFQWEFMQFSPRIIQGMMGGHVLGVVCGHIEALNLGSFLSHIKEKSMLKACRADMP